MSCIKALLIIAIIACACRLNAQEWYPLHSGEGKFQIDFPGEPHTLNEEEKHGNLKHDVLIYRFDNKEKMSSYFAAVTFYGEEIIDSMKLIREKADDFPSRWSGELIAIFEISNRGIPGYEVEIKINPVIVMRARIFYKNAKLYELVVTAPNERIHTPNVDIFFDSLNIK
ncbi:hypothetical protein ACFLSQ_05845 [Bacteroidota bacterium]